MNYVIQAHKSKFNESKRILYKVGEYYDDLYVAHKPLIGEFLDDIEINIVIENLNDFDALLSFLGNIRPCFIK